MEPRILTPARSNALCTLASVKDRLGLTGSSQDARLTSLIAVVSAAIATFFGRPLVRQRYEAHVTGSGRLRQLLPVWPVDRDSVTVEIDETAETEFLLESPPTGVLYLERGWRSGQFLPGQTGEPNVLLRWIGGYVSPDLVVTWTADLAVTLGQFVRATAANGSPLLYEVTTAGSLGGTEPTWPDETAETVTNGSAVLTARDAHEVPLDIQEAALLTTLAWRSAAGAVPANVTLERIGSQEIQYAQPGAAGDAFAFPRAAIALLRGHL